MSFCASPTWSPACEGTGAEGTVSFSVLGGGWCLTGADGGAWRPGEMGAVWAGPREVLAKAGSQGPSKDLGILLMGNRV